MRSRPSIAILLASAAALIGAWTGVPGASIAQQRTPERIPQVSRDVVVGVPDDEFVFRIPGQAVTAKVGPKGVTGPQIQLGKSGDDTLRGRVNNSAVEIRWREGLVSAQIAGETPMYFKLRPSEDGGLKADGLFRSISSHFRISPISLDGRIGDCRYRLTASGDQYQGERVCSDAVPRDVTIRIPRWLARRSGPEVVATLLGLFLAGP